jgi:DNA-directed RNA polymerase specialized sigma24 family protein
MSASTPDPLLRWLSSDEKTAEATLRDLRRRLTWFFQLRGTGDDAEDLAQEVLGAMAKKCAAGEHQSYDRPEQLMIGIAKNVLRRHFEDRVTHVPLDDVSPGVLRFRTPVRAASAFVRCFETSLMRLSHEDRAALMEYFAQDEWGRADIATAKGMRSGTLRVRVFRIKRRLMELIHQCLNGKTLD